MLVFEKNVKIFNLKPTFFQQLITVDIVIANSVSILWTKLTTVQPTFSFDDASWVSVLREESTFFH
jgi:hypothetical protein